MSDTKPEINELFSDME